MSSMFDVPEVKAFYAVIKKDYSPCDISDALLKANVPGAGFLPDIAPIPSRHNGTNRLVAPISTVVFVPKTHQEGPYTINGVSIESNLPKNKHWSDCPAEGSVVIFQQPADQKAALLGDIVATRLKVRGVRGAIIDGRSRDIVSCAKLCEDGHFQVWTKAISSVGTSLEAKPWAVDVPIRIGDVEVKPGDVLCADEGEKVISVIPHDRLPEIAEMLPTLKEADDGVLKDVQNGVNLKKAFKDHPEHYTNRSKSSLGNRKRGPEDTS